MQRKRETLHNKLPDLTAPKYMIKLTIYASLKDSYILATSNVDRRNLSSPAGIPQQFWLEIRRRISFPELGLEIPLQR